MNRNKELEDDLIIKKEENEQQINSLQEALEALSNEKIELRQSIEMYETQNENLVSEQSTKLEEQVAEYTKKCAALEEELIYRREENKITKELQKQYEDQLKSLEGELNSKAIEYEKETATHKQEIEDLKSSLESNKNSMKELESVLTEKEGSESTALITITKERDELNKTLDALKSEVESANTRLKELEPIAKEREEQIQEWKEKYEELNKINEELLNNKDKENLEATLNQMRIMSEELQAKKKRLETENHNLVAENESLKERIEELEKAVKDLQEAYDEKTEQCEQLIVESNKLTDNYNELRVDIERLNQENAKLEEKVFELMQHEQKPNNKLEDIEKTKKEELDFMFGQDEKEDKEDVDGLIEDKKAEDFKVNLAEDGFGQIKDSERKNLVEDDLARLASERENYRIQVVSLTDIQNTILEKLAEEGVTQKDPIDGIEELIRRYRKEFDDFNTIKENIEESLSKLVELLPENMQESVTNQDELITAIAQVLTNFNNMMQANDEVEKLQAALRDKDLEIAELKAQIDGLSKEVNDYSKK